MAVGAYLLSQLPGGSQNQSLSGFQLNINLLENGNGKSGRFPSARLGLSNYIIT